eukprot:4138095-Pyramimonas_sp.AAC.1
MLTQDPADIQSPDCIPEDTTSKDSAVCALHVRQASIKSVTIETIKIQSKMAAPDEDLRQNPELVKADVMAELLRCIDGAIIWRQSKEGAWHLLNSRYAFTWKLQNDGARIAMRRPTVRGFMDMGRGHLDKRSGAASSRGQRA